MGCVGSKRGAPPAEISGPNPNVTNPTAVFDTTMGQFEATIYLDRVPITASNFIDLVESGFYNGVHFHRVIPGFMDQFGCPYARDPFAPNAGTGGPPDGTFINRVTEKTEKARTRAVARVSPSSALSESFPSSAPQRSGGGNIQDENISRDTNCAKSLSMANTGRPNSGGSQFFINVANNSNLDWFSPGPSKHPVFGMITSGYDVVVAISNVPTNDDCPVTPIKMNSITMKAVTL